MSQAPSLSPPTPGQSILLTGVDWKTYSRLLRIFAERPRLRLTYDRGALEIMTPSLDHDDSSRNIYSFIFAMAEELQRPLKHGGAVTMRRRLRRRGIEADECFWIDNAHRMAGVRRLDLRRHPPPDLAVEVDVSRTSLNRLAIYAALGVPEVWRFENDILTFYVLNATGGFDVVPASRSFPLVASVDLQAFVQQARQAGNVIVVVQQFRQWLRQRLAAPPSPPPSSGPP